MNKEYVQADKRIVMGFIEPHFMAGFSGGYKGVFPAVADIASIMHYHRAAAIGHPKSTWGVLDGNPTHAIALSRDGRLALAVDGWDGPGPENYIRMVLWDAATGKRLRELTKPPTQ